MCLAWMNTASDKHYFLPSYFSRTQILVRVVLFSLNSIGDSKQRNIKPTKCLTKSRSFQILIMFTTHLSNKILQSRVGIGQSIGK